MSTPTTLSVGLLLARLVIGPLMAAHGAQKLLGWFGGPGLRGTGEFFIQLGFQQGRTFALAASLTEVTAGLLIATGFLGPIGPALMLSVMIVAAMSVHWKNGVFAMQNGIELPLLYATAAVALAMIGFGAYSLDVVLGLADVWPAWLTWAALAGGAFGGIANLALRRPPVQAARS